MIARKKWSVSFDGKPPILSRYPIVFSGIARRLRIPEMPFPGGPDRDGMDGRAMVQEDIGRDCLRP
ncbi:hypothetical protein CCGE525_30740 (plasmid) [Rhizobium jaguaris]|uniref:Uncharacterized protein n=1 Tax=Rhizobium jaguaris TaxID=1312183 RepID=A0A387FWQ4_9HYPH|nr:hypothetical protein CCGE525_30740 [Rhizobium jaguaris]